MHEAEGVPLAARLRQLFRVRNIELSFEQLADQMQCQGRAGRQVEHAVYDRGTAIHEKRGRVVLEVLLALVVAHDDERIQPGAPDLLAQPIEVPLAWPAMSSAGLASAGLCEEPNAATSLAIRPARAGARARARFRAR